MLLSGPSASVSDVVALAALDSVVAARSPHHTPQQTPRDPASSACLEMSEKVRLFVVRSHGNGTLIWPHL
jgi:hypothetical protein